MTTYVFGEDEVKKTGRTAKKPVPGGRFLVVEEITPINPDNGTWKKFVSPNALFEIEPEPSSIGFKGIQE